MFKSLIRFFKKIFDALFQSRGEEFSFVSLSRSEENPIISPDDFNDWEAWQTFNPGVVSLDNKIHFLYRAIGTDGASRLGYANSNDGFKINERLPYPVYRHRESEGKFIPSSLASGGGWGGAEDPRIVQVDNEDKLHMTYTAFNHGIRVAVTSIKIEDFLNKRWRWEKPTPISPPGEVHKNWMIFPERINGKYAVLHSINPEIQIKYVDNFDFGPEEFIESRHGGLERNGCWDKWIRGAGGPPIKTKDGWLLLYHAMSEGQDQYKVGAWLLDLENPTKILHRSKAPILKPEKHYENNGHKSGVVYVSGTVVKGGQLIAYYGGADSYVCAASAPLDRFIKAIKEGATPTLEDRTI